ncbi:MULTISPECIES: class I SAM-dependent methyltransferase [Clostridium]|uniref:16S rRNA (Cytosine(1402)-N(4))-methyltransferase n=1 Tax=Clostridium senegalense TaxID=1465809 RepID=A0A6M0H2R6_9CLOT|nr:MULTISPECIES: class I SAM-dependent methyltransferase [Clostridium]NEU05070.1 16S rRNA (cytosine(1402)-N(4))-methyltransferase [Clostridium senegalense]
MFEYVSDVSMLSQHIIKNFTKNKNVAIDGTLGNGYDTDFLSENFNKVYSFDIQKIAVDNYKKRNNNKVELINDSHSKLEKYIKENVDAIMYNLGFLPGGDKSITTMVESTIKSIESGLELLNSGGIVSIAIYVGHDEGKKEEMAIMKYVKNLDKKLYGVMLHEVLNRSESAPKLLIIEKK